MMNSSDEQDKQIDYYVIVIASDDTQNQSKQSALISAPVEKKYLNRLKSYLELSKKISTKKMKIVKIAISITEFNEIFSRNKNHHPKISKDKNIDIRLLTVDNKINILNDRFLYMKLCYSFNDKSGAAPILIKNNNLIYYFSQPYGEIFLLDEKIFSNFMKHFPVQFITNDVSHENFGEYFKLINKKQGLITEEIFNELNPVFELESYPQEIVEKFEWINSQQEVMIREKNRVDVVFVIGKDSKNETGHQEGVEKLKKMLSEKKITYIILGDGIKPVLEEEILSLPRANHLIVWGHGNRYGKTNRHEIVIHENSDSTLQLLVKTQSVTQCKKILVCSCYGGAVASDIKQEVDHHLLPGTFLILPSAKDESMFQRDSKYLIIEYLKVLEGQLNVIEFSQNALMSVPQTFGFVLMPDEQDFNENIKQQICFIKVTEQAKKHIFYELDRFRVYGLSQFHSYLNQLMVTGKCKGINQELDFLGVNENNLLPVNIEQLMTIKKDKPYGMVEYLKLYTDYMIINHLCLYHADIIDRYLTDLTQFAEKYSQEWWSSSSDRALWRHEMQEFDSVADKASYFMIECILQYKQYPGSIDSLKMKRFQQMIAVFLKHGADVYAEHAHEIDHKSVKAIDLLIDLNQVDLLDSIFHLKKGKQKFYPMEYVMQHAPSSLVKQIMFEKVLFFNIKQLTVSTINKIKQLSEEGGYLQLAVSQGNVKVLKCLLSLKVVGDFDQLYQLASLNENSNVKLEMQKLLLPKIKSKKIIFTTKNMSYFSTKKMYLDSQQNKLNGWIENKQPVNDHIVKQKDDQMEQNKNSESEKVGNKIDNKLGNLNK